MLELPAALLPFGLLTAFQKMYLISASSLSLLFVRFMLETAKSPACFGF